MKIEELQAELHLAELRAKRVERETPVNTESVEGAGTTPDKPPPVIEGTTASGKAAATTEMTESSSKSHPEPLPADAPAQESTKLDEKRKSDEPLVNRLYMRELGLDDQVLYAYVQREMLQGSI